MSDPAAERISQEIVSVIPYLGIKLVRSAPFAFTSIAHNQWVEDPIFEPPRNLLENMLQRYAKSEGIASRQLYLIRAHFHGQRYDVVPDAEFGLVLREGPKNPRTDDKSLCSIWFNVMALEEVLFVKQIQGMPGRKDELNGLRWERMLLRFFVEWARPLGVIDIRVVNSRKQAYYRDERKERFHLIHDVSAAREGFSIGEEYHTLSLLETVPL